jgi:hypothetical protein
MRRPLLSAVLALGLLTCLACGTDLSRESGVLLPNQMDDITNGQLAEAGLLEAGEELRAWYDNTVSLDGTELYVVTDRRLVSHIGGNTTALPLAEIESVERVDDVLGEAILVTASGGRLMKVPIPPLNGIDTFERVLTGAMAAAR